MTRTNLIQTEAIALNVEGQTAPEWIQLLPAGPEIKGRDGRAWNLADPENVISAFNTYGADLPIDFEHATHVKGDMGEAAPAVGWIKGLEARNKEIWGRIDWLDAGRDAVVSRSYRYISPVFGYSKSSGNILGIKSAGLTNQPNLQLSALNKEGNQEEPSMEKALLDALGLTEGASTDDALTAINKLKSDEATARNRADNPDVGSFVPRADYDLAMNKIRKFEGDEQSRREDEITASIDAAVEAGKIAPVSRKYHTAACREEGGLKRFNDLMGASPEIAGKEDFSGKDPAKASTALSTEEIAACRALGMSEEDFATAKAEEKSS